jgi:hypothetical protein
MENEITSRKSTARLAGLLFLLWIITGFYDMFYLSSRIDTRGDMASAAQNILSREFLFRTGIFMGLITSTLWVFMVLVFYRLFKPVQEHQAKLLVALVIVQIPIGLMMATFDITTLMILKGKVLNSFELIQRQELAMLFLKLSDYGVIALELFWGLWLFPLGILTYRSRFLPRFLGIWLLINGVVYVVLSFTSVVLPNYKDAVFTYTMPAMFGELVFMLWLLIKGARQD